jgi:large subunit ribosomal protein L24
MSARLRKGDEVIVISGKDKGKKGKIMKLDHEQGAVVVTGVNLVKRHMRPTAKNPQGGILEREQWIFVSKVQPIDPKTGKGTRIKVGKDEKGHKVRLAKSGEQIPTPKATGEAS